MDTFQTIGAILALLLLIFQVFDRVPQLRRLFLSSVYLLKGRWRIFKEWRWWRQYRPSYEIVKIGELKISENNRAYSMELPIDIRYTSRDSRHDTKMDTTSVYLDVLNTGKGRDKKPYRLSRNNFSLKIYPKKEDEDTKGGYLVINPIWTLPCRSNVIIRYRFFGQIDALPLLGAFAPCQIRAIGEAEVEGTNKRQLKSPDKFSVKVTWEK